MKCSNKQVACSFHFIFHAGVRCVLEGHQRFLRSVGCPDLNSLQPQHAVAESPSWMGYRCARIANADGNADGMLTPLIPLASAMNPIPLSTMPRSTKTAAFTEPWHVCSSQAVTPTLALTLSMQAQPYSGPPDLLRDHAPGIQYRYHSKQHGGTQSL